MSDKLLNKIYVLDKGHVALYCCAPTYQDFQKIQYEYYRGVADDRQLEIPEIYLSLRCPLFIEAAFHEFGISSIRNRSFDVLEAYIPTVADIKASTLETSQDIINNIKLTTEALLLNPTAYSKDGCDRFVAQVNVPISTYTDVLMKASLKNWISIINYKGFPKPTEAYRSAIHDVLIGEYKNLDDIIKRLKR